MTNNAIIIEKREIPIIKQPDEESLSEIDGPQKRAKYLGLELLKNENLPNSQTFIETTFAEYRPDIALVSPEKEIFVECFSCRINKVLSYLSQNKELWVLTKGAYPWDKTPLQEYIQWFVVKRGPSWEKCYSKYANNQTQKLKAIKNPLDS